MGRAIISTMCMAAVIVLAASCNKIEENADSTKSNGRTVINGVAGAIGNGTKAYNAYRYDVLWQENDEIYVTQADGTNDLFVLDEGKDTSKGKFVEKGNKGISGDIEAFYPASLKTDDGYVWPATQTNDQVAPMYAKQAISGTGAETVNFSSLGAMLQIAFSTRTQGITLTSITLNDSKKPLSGLFTVSDGQAIMEENSANPGVTLDLGTSGVPVGVAAKYFYLAIPAGTYSTLEKDEEMTITFKDDIHGKKCVMTSTTFPDIARNTVGKITLSGSFENIMPTGALPGKFTVDMDGKQVYFSKGNLQATYHSSTESYSWAFAANQYDIIGNAAGNTTIGENQTDGAVVDLFGWSTVAKYYGIDASTNRNDYSGDFVDWGTAYCKDYDILPEDTWRTLSTNEWNYLIQHNKNCWATVNGICGLVIAPDDFEGNINNAYDPVFLSEYNLVFLPAESVRRGLNLEVGIGKFGHYYSSTPVTGYSAFGLYFYDKYVSSALFHDRHNACCVRLVTDVKYTPAEKRRYTVSFRSTKGTEPAPFMTDTGSTISKPEDPTAPGYEFMGWYKDYNCQNIWDFDTDKVTRDIVLFAKWPDN